MSLQDNSTGTSVWDSEEIATVDDQIQEALRLKQQHEKLTKTMEKVCQSVRGKYSDTALRFPAGVCQCIFSYMYML